MKITGLHVENIKRVKLVDIKPLGNVTIISGKNGNGKSSTLDAIAMALGGADLVPSVPVRIGETKAKIVVDMGEYIVTRWWTSPESNYLKLETKDGDRIQNAQTRLDKIIGDLSFDPLEFSTMEPKKRLDVLKKITGVDSSEIDRNFAVAYEKRRDANKHRDTLASIFKKYDSLCFIDKTIDEKELDEKMEKTKQNNAQFSEAKRLLVAGELKESQISLRIKEINSRIQILDAEKKDLDAQMAQTSASLLKIKESPLVHIDESFYAQDLKMVFEWRANQKELAQKKLDLVELDAAVFLAKNTDDLCAQLKDKRERLISSAKMPVAGLKFSDNDITYNEVPFSQLSTSEQIKVSFSISIAMNGTLKLAIIKNGSLLDSDALAEIEKIANENDTQVFIEMVASGPESGCIYIQDGEVLETVK